MDLEQVTLTQMRYAVAVQETENFRGAAERCFVSQSGLSMQIQKLEELLGTVLFDRTKRPVLVTPRGAAVLAQMRVILRETARLGQVAADDREPAGPYRLGVIPTLAPTVLPLFLGDFAERYPRVELLIEELKTEEMVARLRDDTLDAGIAATPLAVAGLAEVALAQESLMAYLPAGDPLLKKRAIAQGDLQDRPLWVMPEGHCFRSQVLSYCRADNPQSKGHIRFESGSFETLVRLVDGGLGATILPALVVQRIPARKRRIHMRPLVGPTPVREIGFVTSRADLRRSVHDALKGIIRERLATALGPAPRRARVLDPLS